jgi:hypothetical protein
MRHSLIRIKNLRLNQTKAFWWLRSRLKRVSFQFHSKYFSIRHGLRQERENYGVLQEFFSFSGTPLLVAILCAVALQTLDPLLKQYYKNGFGEVPNDGDYTAFLVAISTIGGVFIGLYYAGLSAIVSAIYARVPNNVRKLLAHERAGNFYMRYLSFVTVLCVMLTAFRVFGLPRIALAIPVVTLLGAVGIFAFVKLGQRAFNLFDPTALSRTIFEELDQWLSIVRVGGNHWLDKSFQNHAHDLASSSIDTLETLADLVREQQHLNGEPFAALGANIVRYLIRNEVLKKEIPTQSAWYQTQYEHRDWYLTDVSRVSVAHQTGTALEPRVTNDSEWIEKRLYPIVIDAFVANVREGKFSAVQRLLPNINGYATVLSREGRAHTAYELLNQLSPAVFESMPAKKSNASETEPIELLALAEHLATIPITIFLGWMQCVESFDRISNENRLTSMDWRDKGSVYRNNFATRQLDRIEWLQSRLEFEIKILGNPVTPPWYRNELVTQIEAESFVAGANVIVNDAIKYFSTTIEGALITKRPWLASAVMSREWEYWNKFGTRVNSLIEIWKKLTDDHRIDGLEWPTFDLKEMCTKVESRQNKLLEQMCVQGLLLSTTKRPSGFPDYPGQFLHCSGEEVFNAMLQNRADLFTKLFPTYLISCLHKFNSLRPKSGEGWRLEHEFKAAAAVLLDVMDLSGYAKLFADLHDNQELWNAIVAAWDERRKDDSENSLEVLLGLAVSVTEQHFEIPHRAILRTTWKRAVEHALSEIPSTQSRRSTRYGHEPTAQHSSVLVRLFANSYTRQFDGVDVFIEFFIRPLSVGDSIDFGRKRRRLKDQLAREEAHAAADADSDENNK